jgi:hypothetical protein
MQNNAAILIDLMGHYGVAPAVSFKRIRAMDGHSERLEMTIRAANGESRSHEEILHADSIEKNMISISILCKKVERMSLNIAK